VFGFGNAPLIGLDIGTATVKAVTLIRRAENLIAERLAIAAMPAPAPSGGASLEASAVSRCLREFCRQEGFRGERVSAGLAGEDLLVARLKLSAAAGQTLETAVREEAARLAPLPLEQYTLDYQVLDNSSDGQAAEALLVAAKRERVERLREIVRQAGKKLVVADSTACALANVFELNYQPQPAEITVLLHLGAATMTACILRGSTPLLVRDVSLAPLGASEQEWPRIDRVAVELERVLEWMDEIADEHPLEPRSTQIQRLMLSGGGARLKGLDQVLRARFNRPLEELNPFRRILFKNGAALSRLVLEQAHCLPVAVGLALREFEP